MVILYEDNHLIAVEKPHGQPTQGDDSGDLSLLDEVKEFIKERDQKPGNVFVGLLHRLDRPVGGVVLFAKTSKAASRLSDQIRRHTVEKVYLAKTEGVPNMPPERQIGDGVFSLRQWLLKDEKTNTVKSFDHETPGALEAETSYKVLKPGLESLVEIHPKTGRPHQIRVAMSSLGAPIVGDIKYGAKTKYSGNLALQAQSLSFDHPITKERITVYAKTVLS